MRACTVGSVVILAAWARLGLRPLEPTGWVCFSSLLTALSPEGGASADTCLARPTCRGSAPTHRGTENPSRTGKGHM